MLGEVVTLGLLTEAGFSYNDDGAPVVGLVLGVPGVTVGPAVLDVGIFGGLVTAAGFS